jgi:asparagine synthase (glutamine-hydrolysing)
MCGIAGFYNSSLNSSNYPETIKKMLSFIRHRGPDEAGYYADDNVVMGTVRLSIIDLQTGTQPLSDKSERYWICYNGELYNYKELRKELELKGHTFITTSDTEVVLLAWVQWKEECLLKFNGAFAFAIYDTQESSLFLARDRYGKRPLFYSQQNNTFIFASEMKAFFGYDKFDFTMDTKQLASIFTIWTPLPHQSGFKNIHQLPNGEYLIVKGNVCTKKDYTQLNFKTKPFNKTESEAIELIREALSESVRLRLRSDVEVGIYLSGGLDSSIVTQLVTQASSQQFRTFSIEFDNKEFDESKEQMAVAQYFNTCHSFIRITDKDITDNFPKALYYAEMPVFRTAFVPMYLLSNKVSNSGIKVILSGEGSDEAFLGYDIFKETLLRSTWKSLNSQQRKEKLTKVHPFLNHFNAENSNFLMGLYQQYAEENLPHLFSHEMRFQNGRFSTRLLQTQDDPFTEIYKLIEQENYISNLTTVQKAQWLEYKTLLAGYLLSTQGDRMGMANGVENRCPFLDPYIVELASNVNLKFDDGFNEKYILKKAFQDRLPEAIIKRNKLPYRAPDSAAFVNERPDYLDLIFSETELKKVWFLNTTFCQLLIKKIFSTSPELISAKENQAFMFLISSMLLYHFFVLKDISVTERCLTIEDILVKKVDKRMIL